MSPVLGGRGHCCSPHNCPVARIQSSEECHQHIESENLYHSCLTLNNVELWPPNLSLVNTPHPAACSRSVLYYVLIGIGSICALRRLMLQYILRYCGKTLSWGVGKILKLNPIF